MTVNPVALPAPVSAFRDRYRADEVSPRYSGRLHAATTFLSGLAAIGYAIASVSAPSALELVTIPVAFLVANLIEYLGHRGPMHHRWRGLGLLHRRHAVQHHSFFTHEAMAVESTRDWKMVLFPPAVIFFFVGFGGLPFWAVLHHVATPNVAWLFLATAVSYFITYEALHFAYHQPSSSWIARLPFMAALRRHHELHHDPANMQRLHFNISFPVFDAILGTLRPRP